MDTFGYLKLLYRGQVYHLRASEHTVEVVRDGADAVFAHFDRHQEPVAKMVFDDARITWVWELVADLLDLYEQDYNANE